MKKPVYSFKGKVWLYPDKAHAVKGAPIMKGAWYFITLPKKESKEIEQKFTGPFRRGWGSVPVEVTIGNSTWRTSIFPDKIAQAYLLPVKAQVRDKEGIEPGKLISYSIEIRA